MKRREFIAATAALLVWPWRSRAQGTPRRIGSLGGFQNLPILKVFHEGLRDHGWIEGKNLIIDYRYFEGHAERIPALAAELVALKPDLLIGFNPQAAIALKSATATIPIVFVAVADPVGLGLVQSLAHPGGNITGLATIVPEDFLAKRIEILRELVPSASKIALLVNPSNPMHKLILAEQVPRITRDLGVALTIVEATTAEELDVAFASAAAQHVDAIVDVGDSSDQCKRSASCRARGETSSARDVSLPTIRQRQIDRIRRRHRRSVPPCRPTTWTRYSKAPNLQICR